MITNIWLKSQPNKKIPYPDCFPVIHNGSKSVHIHDSTNTASKVCIYSYDAISRMEFRP